MSLWVTICQYLTILVDGKWGLATFSFYYVLVLLGLPLFLFLNHRYLQKVKWTTFTLTVVTCSYFFFFFFFITVNILTISFIDRHLMIFLSDHFIGKSFIERIAGSTEINLRNYSAKINVIISFYFFSIFPILYLIRMIIKEDVDRSLILLQQKRESELKSYIEMIETINQDLQRLHHDINNVLSTLGVHLHKKKIDEKALRCYYQEIQEEFGLSKMAGIPAGKLEYFHNPEVLGLILDKIMKAKELDIHLKVEVSESISLPQKNILALVRIIGILIDNALEETKNLPSGKVQIVFLSLKEEKILIQIENQTKNLSFFQQYISGHVSSTKSESRGIGLQNVSELIKKNRNLHLDCKQTASTVQFSLLIDLKKR